MKTLTATQARKDIYRIIESLGQSHEAIQITGKAGNAILISESDWNAIQETLYLLSIPDIRATVKKGLKTPIEKCTKELDW